jgi:hypothetical protein
MFPKVLWKGGTTVAQEEPDLVRRRAFVVQFRADTDLAQARCTGRVEHVVSGQATHFQSLEELLAFLTRILTAVRAQPPPAT